ncbi:hypothetical protein SRABI106_01071 [Rahnella aquatilis]|nr:hypothetical protein SRABI106_01071 [Rahnella aquatilis]
MAVTDDFTQRTNDVGFSFEVHGQVRMIPVAQHAQTDEVFLLAFNLLCCVFTAGFTEFCCRDFLARLADQLFDFKLDWQTMTVPARHIRRIKARQSFGLNDHVFKNFVY